MSRVPSSDWIRHIWVSGHCVVSTGARVGEWRLLLGWEVRATRTMSRGEGARGDCCAVGQRARQGLGPCSACARSNAVSSTVHRPESDALHCCHDGRRTVCWPCFGGAPREGRWGGLQVPCYGWLGESRVWKYSQARAVFRCERNRTYGVGAWQRRAHRLPTAQFPDGEMRLNHCLDGRHKHSRIP